MSNFSDILLEANINNNNTYTYNDNTYYKLIGKNSIYFIDVSDYYTITLQQKPVTLFTLGISGLEQLKGYIKAIESSSILLVAAPSITSSFSMYDLEKIA